MTLHLGKKMALIYLTLVCSVLILTGVVFIFSGKGEFLGVWFVLITLPWSMLLPLKEIWPSVPKILILPLMVLYGLPNVLILYFVGRCIERFWLKYK